MTPNSGLQGQNVNVQFAGTNFVPGSTVIVISPPAGITVGPVIVQSGTSATATLTITANAATGPRSVSVSTPDGTSDSLLFNVFGSTQTSTFGYSVSTVAGLTTIAEGESATTQPLPNIRDVAQDAAGNLYIAVFNRHKVYKIAPDGTLTTFAGNGVPGPAGDGGLATAAQLSGPRSVSLDASANVYIADSSNNRIRMVGTDGTITTVAGNPAAGFSGDGGSARAATLSSPSGVLVDASGNLFILDRANQRIRKIDPFGRIFTVAGTGTAGFSGDGGPATAAQLFLDTGSNRMALDASSNLYIPDTLNHRIRKVSADGNIATVAGNGTSGFSGDNGLATAAQLASPRSVALDSSGNLYISDTGNNRIRKVTSGTISTFAGTGNFGFNGEGLAATSSFLANPNGLIFDPAGNLYFADELNNRVRRIAAGIVTTLAGQGPGFSGDNGPLLSARFYSPGGIATDPSGNVFIADTRNARIRKLTPTGTLTTVAGNGSTSTNGSGGPALTTAIGIVNDVAVDRNTGAVFFAGTDNRVRKLGTDGSITVVAGSGTSGLIDGPATEAQIANPQGVAVAPNGDVYVTDSNNRIRKLSSGVVTTVAGNGSTQGDGGPAIDALLSGARKIVVESSTGNIYFTERTTGRLRKIDTSGIITSVLTSGAGWGLGFDFSGDLYSSGYSLISKTPPGGTTTRIASPGTNTASVQGFTGDSGAAKLVAIAAAGLAVSPAGEVYFADDQDQLIRKLTPVPEGSAALSVTSLGFFIRSSTQTTQNLPIALDGIGSFTWTASVNNANWLTINPLNGTGSGSTTLTVNPTGLAPGNYNGSLTISSPQAVNGPVIVPVTLVVPPQPPALTVVNPSNGIAGATANVELTGTNFVNGATAVVVTGTGVTTTSVNVVNGTLLNATVAIASDAAPGDRGIYVVTAGGSSATQTFTVGTPLPTLQSVTPDNGNQAQTVGVTLGGSPVNNLQVQATQISATVNMAADATVGVRGLLVSGVDTAGANTGLTFQVNPSRGSGTPSFTGIVSGNGNPATAN
jgi:sugar lactone lactonase YvrE